ncbi:hypothetical protein BLX24_28090 [Arsenicibacter rosenii]|uniref:HTH luxR-type domain-containing protein n=2 Tax=Arsenicibacter rosenii TaxID=1750698 RepID=A0A1S2VD22_9BACT|nr:hypothetical protein BLX24_28090 [Arsenicibacter rosenii]
MADSPCEWLPVYADTINYRVCDYYRQADNVYDSAAAYRPDLLLVDTTMQNGQGLLLAQQLMLAYPACRTIALLPNCPALIQQAQEYDISGFLPLWPCQDELIQCINAVRQRRRYLSPHIGASMQVDTRRPVSQYTATLSIREKAVLQLLQKGLSNPEIAAQLGVSVTTVNTHKQNIVNKLELKNRRELMVIATALFG